MAALNRFLQMASQRQDLVFAVFFVLIVAMLVFPLPVVLVDALLAANLVLSLVILITATYLKHPLELSTFPSIILMTSILRVALSVATTRLILAYGDAGHLILAFGEFVIGGNIVVGLVIFLIIALVQFMVVTKGAERISEVSARFTLDAMPGKQMSIDNDLRSGDIDKVEARRRRTTLEKEMQFHGAMDGAMRFVKGDAIASLIIVFINLVGGLVIGMVQRGLPFSEAGRLYVLLSVGDGLIAQIPAMFIALAAGTIVTRVATEESSNLGKDVTTQLAGEPKALAVSGVVALAMALIPGFPSVVFLILGGLLSAAAFFMLRPARPDGDAPGLSGEGGSRPADSPPAELLPLRPAQPGDVMTISGGTGTLDLLRLDSAYVHVERSKEDFRFRMGFTAPPVGFRYDDRMPAGAFAIEIDGVPVRRFSLDGVEPPAALSPEQASAYAAEVAAIRLRYASSLFGVPEATQWLQDVQPQCGRLATDVQQLMPFMTLVDALRRLLDDGVGLLPPRLILEGLVQASQRAQDPDTVAEFVRSFLRRQVCFAAADANRVIHALVLGPDVETSLRQMGGGEQGMAGVRANDETAQQFVERARTQVAEQRGAGLPVVVMTTADTRRIARRLLRQNGVEVPVLSYADVAADYQVQTVGVLAGGRLAA